MSQPVHPQLKCLHPLLFLNETSSHVTPLAAKGEHISVQYPLEPFKVYTSWAATFPTRFPTSGSLMWCICFSWCYIAPAACKSKVLAIYVRCDINTGITSGPLSWSSAHTHEPHITQKSCCWVKKIVEQPLKHTHGASTHGFIRTGDLGRGVESAFWQIIAKNYHRPDKQRSHPLSTSADQTPAHSHTYILWLVKYQVAFSLHHVIIGI